MEYITTKEASAKWKISTQRITLLANEGRIPGAQRLGRSWLIPSDALKPVSYKPGKLRSENTVIGEFSFPLYHYRPDWDYINKKQLSHQQQILLIAENAVMECRFLDAYNLIEPIVTAPENKITEIGGLGIAGMCCIALNKARDFSRIYLRLKMLLSEDFTNRDDLVVILDLLKTYLNTISFAANNDAYNTNIHNQCIPLTCMLVGYSQLAKEILTTGTSDITIMELMLRFLKTTSATVAIEMMHIYIMGIYYMRQEMKDAETHAREAVQIAYEKKLYFPLVTYYKLNAKLFAQILAEYPKDFQKHCKNLASQYVKNYADFLVSITDYSVFAELNDINASYVYAVLSGLSNAEIAKRLEVSIQTVNRNLEKLYEKFGVNSKNELKKFLIKTM